MSEGREDSVGVLRRKVRIAGNSPAPIARAARRAADLVLEMDLRITAIEDSVLPTPEAVGSLADPILLVRFRLAQSGGSCLFALDSGLFSAIGEQTTLAMVAPNPPEPRKPTRVDMAMCAPFLEAFLTQLGEEAPEADLTRLTRSAQDPLMIANLAEAEMSLPDRPGAFFRISISAAGREGMLFVLIPETAAAGSGEALWRSKLDAAVLPAQGELEAVLCRLPMTIERLKSLSVGDHVPIPKTAISRVSLEGPDRVQVTTARLGQLDGHRAVCINAGAKGSQEKFAPTGGEALPDETPDLALPMPGEDPGLAAPGLDDGPGFDSPEGGLTDLPDPELGDLPNLGGEGDGLADLGQFGDLSDFDGIPGEAEDLPELEGAPMDFAAVGLDDT